MDFFLLRVPLSLPLPLPLPLTWNIGPSLSIGILYCFNGDIKNLNLFKAYDVNEIIWKFKRNVVLEWEYKVDHFAVVGFEFVKCFLCLKSCGWLLYEYDTDGHYSLENKLEGTFSENLQGLEWII